MGYQKEVCLQNYQNLQQKSIILSPFPSQMGCHIEVCLQNYQNLQQKSIILSPFPSQMGCHKEVCLQNYQNLQQKSIILSPFPSQMGCHNEVCLQNYQNLQQTRGSVGWACVTHLFHSALRKLNLEPSIGASHQISVHFSKAVSEKKIFRNRPI
jgi:hypothetical protein